MVCSSMLDGGCLLVAYWFQDTPTRIDEIHRYLLETKLFTMLAFLLLRHVLFLEYLSGGWLYEEARASKSVLGVREISGLRNCILCMYLESES